MERFPGESPVEQEIERPIKLAGFSENAKLEKGGRVLEQLKNNTPRWYLEKTLYVYLTERVSEDELSSIEESFNKVDGKEKYKDNLEKVARDSVSKGLVVKADGAWFGIGYSSSASREKEKLTKTSASSNESVEVSYKEYFTVPIQTEDAESALKNIEQFQNVLTIIAEELKKLSEKEGDAISLKVPQGLQFFIKHPDSLVVHYRNKDLSEQIRTIVINCIESTGLTTIRENRVKSGFDFASKKELYNGSHSSLMASIAADKLIENIKTNPHLVEANPKDIAQFLDRAFDDYGKFSPKEMLDRLDQIKS